MLLSWHHHQKQQQYHHRQQQQQPQQHYERLKGGGVTWIIINNQLHKLCHTGDSSAAKRMDSTLISAVAAFLPFATVSVKRRSAFIGETE